MESFSVLIYKNFPIHAGSQVSLWNFIHIPTHLPQTDLSHIRLSFKKGNVKERLTAKVIAPVSVLRADLLI
jgi:hypothetical protein